MITLLAKLFLNNPKQYSNKKTRLRYGMLCGVLGIVLNLLLFASKFIVGVLSNSIAISADALNNLSDAGSSIVTLFGFRLANKAPDSDHPHGHGRYEYIAGLIVSILILFMGYELISISIHNIINPSLIEYSSFALIILVSSISVKFYMYLYNKNIGNKIDSTALKASSIDSLSDCISTSVVLLCILLSPFTSLPLDGYSGCFVGLFVIYAGIKSTKETISPLLGNAPSKELIEEIKDIVHSYDIILDIHDLLVHDYGPGRMVISLHAEVPSDSNFVDIHDTIDRIEKKLQRKLGCHAIIHMDPVCHEDEETIALKEKITQRLQDISPEFHLHDFRVVKGNTHSNIIFDVESPFQPSISDQDLLAKIHDYIQNLDGNYYGVITIDKY